MCLTESGSFRKLQKYNIENMQTHLTNIQVISRGGTFSQMCFQQLRGLSLQRHQEEAPGPTVGDVAILDSE